MCSIEETGGQGVSVFTFRRSNKISPKFSYNTKIPKILKGK